MKVLQLGKFYPIRGGVEKVMYDLMLGLSHSGVRCDMACATTKGHTRTIIVNPLARLTCCHTWMKMKATTIAPGLNGLMRRIKSDYDIVHVHHPDPMACVALYTSGYKGHVVLHWHSDILKQKKLLHLYKPFQNWIINRADMIVGTSPVYLKESPFLQHVQHKTVCLPIGIAEVPQVSDKAIADLRARYEGRKIIFSLGRLVGYKGFEHLIDAAAMLPEDYVVLIGGTGPLHHELQQRINALHLQNKVRLLGYVADADVPLYYRACHLFCLSSVFKTEAFGIVQIEAMACGKPVVATTIPGSGVAWVNEHGVSGLNVEPGNAAELAKAIRTILADEETYAGFSARARHRFEEKFTLSRMVSGCLDIYRQVLQQNTTQGQSLT